jgi:hypothetical protein
MCCRSLRLAAGPERVRRGCCCGSSCCGCCGCCGAGAAGTAAVSSPCCILRACTCAAAAACRSLPRSDRELVACNIEYAPPTPPPLSPADAEPLEATVSDSRRTRPLWRSRGRRITLPPVTARTSQHTTGQSAVQSAGVYTVRYALPGSPSVAARKRRLSRRRLSGAGVSAAAAANAAAAPGGAA